MVIQSFSPRIFLFLFADSSLALWKKQETLIFWITLILLFVSGLLFCLIYIFNVSIRQRYENKLNQQKMSHEYALQLKEATLQSLEEERKRFSNDLHDAIIGKMTAIRYGLQMQIPIEKIDDILGECIEDSRRLSHNLYPPLLKESSLKDLIQHCICLYKTGYEIDYYVDIRQDIKLSEEQKLHMVRMLQELMANTHKHANASKINIRLKVTNYIILLYSDNGNVLQKTKYKGLGLDSIKDRVTQLKGKVKLYPSLNGFRILIVIPQ